MCRLYGFQASHPTEADCELIEAQNSLIRQSEEDARGLVNDHGWGLGVVQDGVMSCEREVGPASESEEYRRDVGAVEATTILAHVRRATVGQPTLENTHPFRHGRSMLIHNGHIGGFDRVQDTLRAEMLPEEREAIAGTTDSEHFFHYLRSLRTRDPETPLVEILARGIRDVGAMVEEVDPDDEVALNVIWAVDDELVASRVGRSLWVTRRRGPHRCGVCGDLHPDPESLDGEEYRAAVIASERITDEDWTEVPEGSVLRVTPDFGLEITRLNSGVRG
jgi:glutamine amidotransferase